MATYTPPPYFPQSSLSPPDEKRYRKFKLTVAAVVIGLLVVVGGTVVGVAYLVKWLF
jgi:heme oxygenase